MRYLDQVLAAQPFLVGVRLTMADITAFAGLAYAAIPNIEIPAGLDRLTSWRKSIAGRPSVMRAA